MFEKLKIITEFQINLMFENMTLNNNQVFGKLILNIDYQNNQCS